MLAPVWFLGTFLVAIVIKGFMVAGTGALGHRDLVLVYAVLFILLAANWHGFWGQANLSVGKKRVIFVALILFVGLTAFRSGQFGTVFYKHGVGYNSKTWAGSPVVRNLRALDNVPVYTNDPLAIYYLTGRPAILIPDSGQRPGHFSAEEKVSDDFNRQRAVAVIFRTSADQRTSLAQAIPAVQFDRFMGDPVAEIYGVKRQR
jgi:hypothetical protein